MDKTIKIFSNEDYCEKKKDSFKQMTKSKLFIS